MKLSRLSLGCVFLVSFVSCKLISASVLTESTPKYESNEIEDLTNRLPKDVRPVHYDLFLRTNLGEEYFNGSVRILINVTKPTSRIVLHARNLTITNSSLISIDFETVIPILKSYQHEEFEYWISELYDEIGVGFYEIGLEFVLKPLNCTPGFYQLKYSEDGSEDENWVAAAEFEPSAARMAFPCFDEPDLKATFTVSIQYAHDNGYYALSNMDIKKVERFENFSVTTFQKSVKMSTYLLTFVITKYENESVTVDTKGIGEPFNLTVIGSDEWKNSRKFALEKGKAIVEFLIDYYGIPFPINKLDMIGVPRDGHPAIETWGLIVYGSTHLFNITTEEQRAMVTYCIAHELAHAWFGNLVTMKWWNDIWLNEGFATFMGLKIVNEIWPELNTDKLFGKSMTESAMIFDSETSTHSVVHPVSDTKDRNKIFGPIAYVKGGAILRMLENYIGEDKLKIAITNYLNKFAFDTAQTSDLIDEIENVVPDADVDVRTFIRAWTEQPGHPIVNVENIGNGTYKLTQTRYFSNKTAYEHGLEEKASLWPIPITYVTDQGDGSETYLLHEDEKIGYFQPQNATWVKFNTNSQPFYRVNYSEQMWLEFSSILSDDISVLKQEDRLHLLSEALALLEHGHLKYHTVFELFRFLKNEDSESIWARVSNIFLTYLKALDIDETRAFKEYFRNIIDPLASSKPIIFSEPSWEPHFYLLSVACSVENDQCLQFAKSQLELHIKEEKFKEFSSSPISVQAAGIRSLPTETWLKLWENCKMKCNNGLHRILAGTNDTSLLHGFLNDLITLPNIDADMYVDTLRIISRTNVSFVWDYIQENIDHLRELKPTINIEKVIEVVRDYLVTDEQMKEMKVLFESYLIDDGEDKQKEWFERAERLRKYNRERKSAIIQFLREREFL